MFRQPFYMELLCLINCCATGGLEHQTLLYKWNRTEPGSQLRKKLFRTFELSLTPEELALTFRAIYDLDQLDEYEFPEDMKQIAECFSNLLSTKDWDALREDLHHGLLGSYASVLMSDLPHCHSILILLGETDGEIGYQTLRAYWKRRVAGKSHKTAVKGLEQNGVARRALPGAYTLECII